MTDNKDVNDKNDIKNNIDNKVYKHGMGATGSQKTPPESYLLIKTRKLASI